MSREPVIGAACPDCGKIRYPSRAEARRHARRHGTRRRAYRCGEFWHLASYKDAADVAYFRRTGQS
jgi:hypothetical protein